MPLSAHHRRLSALLAAAGLAAAAAGAAAAAEETIVLRIDGRAGTPFAATCELRTASGKQTIMIDRKVPFEGKFEGSGLRCEVTAPAPIEVEAAKGGSRSFGSTSRGSVNINVGS